MVEAARAPQPRRPVRRLGRIEEYEPPEPVDATICLRSFYYPADRLAFFRHVAGYTRREVRLRLPAARRIRPAPIVADLRAAGFARIELRPFFLPQRRRASRRASFRLVYALERTGPLASLVAAAVREAVLRAWVVSIAAPGVTVRAGRTAAA